MQQEPTLIPCGTMVCMKQSEIEGMITCQNIRFGMVTYEITYFVSGEHCVVWMNPFEFEVRTEKKTKVGF
jgi:hypothetical protein